MLATEKKISCHATTFLFCKLRNERKNKRKKTKRKGGTRTAAAAVTTTSAAMAVTAGKKSQENVTIREKYGKKPIHIVCLALTHPHPTAIQYFEM